MVISQFSRGKIRTTQVKGGRDANGNEKKSKKYSIWAQYGQNRVGKGTSSLCFYPLICKTKGKDSFLILAMSFLSILHSLHFNLSSLGSAHQTEP